MTSRSLKRPSSARRHIKYETFNQFVSGSRLSKIQSLLKGSNSYADSPDCIVCITGIDSRYNEGNQQFMNYLLFGFLTTRQVEFERSGFSEEILDDIILVINRNSVDIYCNVTNYHYLLPYTVHWMNVRYHCLTDTQAEDEEVEEDFKMLSFVSIMKNKNTVGIPYFSSGHVGQFDKMMVEKWPIIQSFGLDEVGGGGFFTMKYEVFDVSSKVHELYSHMDPVMVEILLLQNFPLLKRQWKDMEVRISLEISTSGGKLTENIASEALFSYYKHGHMVSSRTKPTSSRYPFVLFGCHSNEMDIKKCTSNLIENDKDLKSTGISNKSSLLMVCQAVSPNSPLVCCRTYFFVPVLDPFDDDGSPKKEYHVDLWYLTQLYKTVIEAVISGIQVYSKTINFKKAMCHVLYIIEEKIRELNNPILQDYFQNRSKIVFEIEGIDHSGRCYKLEDGVYSSLVKIASLSLFDVPSIEHVGQSQGSIVFSESFLDSTISIEGKSESSSDCIVLTSNIPRFNLWMNNGEDILRCKNLPTQLIDLTKYGEKLVSGEEIHYTTSTPDFSQIFSASGYIYENSIILHHSQYGCILLTHTDLQHILLYDGGTNNCVWLLVLCLDKTCQSKIPTHLQNDRNQLILIFTPQTKAHKLLFTRVLPRWKTESSFPVVERLDALPKHLDSLHERLENEFVSRSDFKLSTLEKTSSHIYNLSRFVNHLSASCAGCSDVLESDLPFILKTQPDINSQQLEHDEIIINIIGGVTGSHKQTLVSTLTNYTKEKYRWIVLKQPIDEVEDFCARKLQKQLTGAVVAHRRRKTGSSRRETKIIVLTPGLTGIAEIVQTIESHPDSDVISSIKIGAVTVCVDPLNFFLEHRLVLPGLLSDCREGWVNNVILTSCTNGQSDILDEVQGLIRGINSNVSLILAERGEVHRSTDLDNILSDQDFYSPQMIRSRYLSPQNRMDSDETVLPKMKRIVLRFSQPLDKFRFINKLKGLSSSLNQEPRMNNVYHLQGQLHFTDIYHHFEVEFVTLSGYKKILAVESTPSSPDEPQSTATTPGSSSNYLVFTGCNLEDSRIRDWLRSCQPVKPEKKALITRQDVTNVIINKIHKSQHLSPLPSGWFYNGSQFISLAGDKSYQHPNLEEFVEEYIQNTNTEIMENNKKIESMKYTDLFS